MWIYAFSSLLQHSEPATGTFVRQLLQLAVFLNRQTAVPIFWQLRLPLISSFTSHAILLSFGVAQEHSTQVTSNPDGAGWALTYEKTSLCLNNASVGHTASNFHVWYGVISAFPPYHFWAIEFLSSQGIQYGSQNSHYLNNNLERQGVLFHKKHTFLSLCLPAKNVCNAGSTVFLL